MSGPLRASGRQPYRHVTQVVLKTTREIATRRVLHPLLNRGRVPGIWRHADLEWMAQRVRAVEGDFAEIGVFRGRAFQKVAKLARAQGKMAHAFDSFVGMNEPGPLDGVQFPKREFDIGGPEAFVRLMDSRGVERNSYELHPGYIPACFAEVDSALHFSFVILDVDHYEPTVEALNWVWPRVSAEGILALDDFIPTHTILATKAIKEFLRARDDFDIIDFFNRQLILQKLAAAADG